MNGWFYLLVVYVFGEGRFETVWDCSAFQGVLAQQHIASDIKHIIHGLAVRQLKYVNKFKSKNNPYF
jgi:hypothetical protein